MTYSLKLSRMGVNPQQIPETETPSQAFHPPKEADNDNKKPYDSTPVASLEPTQTPFSSVEGEQLKLGLIADNKAPPTPVALSSEPKPSVGSEDTLKRGENTPPKLNNQKTSKPNPTPPQEPENQKDRKPERLPQAPNHLPLQEPSTPETVSSQRYNPKTDPDLKTLRSWYRAAQILGESAQFQQNIYRLARYIRQKHAAQKPVEIGSITQKRIQQDLEKLASHRQLSNSMISASQVILKAKGEPKPDGVTIFKGKTYGIRHQEGNFAVYRLGGETPQPILKITDGVLKLATFHQRDVEAFEAYAQYVQETSENLGS